MPTIVPNFQKNADQIVAYVQQPHIASLFRKRIGSLSHGDNYGHSSRFTSLLSEDMPHDLIKMIFDGGEWDDDLRDFYQFIQIQRYMPGDYIAPHQDKYAIKKLHLVCLTTNHSNGFYVFEDDYMHRIEDVAGTKIEFQYDAVHFVPTCTYERYSLVIAE